MRHIAFIVLAGLASVSIAHAAALEEKVLGGKFVDCEFIDLGPKGNIKGQMSLSELTSDPKWAPVTALILTDDTKFQVTFRLGLASVTTSDKLELRYEFFSGARRPVAEGLAQVSVGEPVNFQLGWDPSGLVQVAVAGAQQRNLFLDMKPTRAFALISGGRGRVSTEGQETIDCSRDLMQK